MIVDLPPSMIDDLALTMITDLEMGMIDDLESKITCARCSQDQRSLSADHDHGGERRTGSGVDHGAGGS